jgi:diguanylate cyclase (GGDEF)-like protein/PAS domain S-box-containing protein
VVVEAYQAIKNLEASAAQRRHTYRLIDHAEDVLSALQDAETGQRGYVLTGDDAFLEPYLAGRESAPRHMRELRGLTLLEPSRTHLDALARLVDAKLAELSQVVELRRRHDTTGAIAAVSGGRGKRLMDSIRTEISGYMRDEHEALEQYEAQSQLDVRRLILVIAAASLLLLLFAVSLGYFIYRETRSRLRHLVHLETQHLLEAQEQTNRQLQQANVALQISGEKLRLFADNVPAMAVSWDENLRCSFANKVFVEFFGLAAEDILGRHVREVLGDEVYREIEGHFAQVLQGQAVTYERTRRLANGECRYLEVKLLPHMGDQGGILGCFAVTTDITEHKLAEERIQRVAHHDSLTGLPNRLLFNDRLNQAISRAKRDSRQSALLYLDLDKFKAVNDTLGHGAGDALLQAVAARLRKQMRESDTVARVGGDEFAVILPDIGGREEAESVAHKIVAALAAPFRLGTEQQHAVIGTSIGVAVYPTDARDAQALIKAADAAMYEAKRDGSGVHACAA